MPYHPVAIANKILDIARDNFRELGMLRLQKLLYFADGHYLALVGKPLITGEFEAWKYGPVSRPVYKTFKPQMSTAPWSADYKVLNPVREESIVLDNEALLYGNRTARAMLESVVSFYSVKQAFELVDLTHLHDSPWTSVYEEGKNHVIPRDAICSYFQNHPLPNTVL